MIAYNRDWLDALLTKKTAAQWHEKGLLSDSQWSSIQAGYPAGFYSPNLFIRIGLAIFGLILLSAVMGLITLFFSPDSELAFFLLSIVWGVMFLVILEVWAVQRAHHFGSGIDDMLLYTGICAIIGGLYYVIPNSAGPLLYCCIAWPFLVIGSIRYLDHLLTIAAFICSLLIILLIVKEIPDMALYLLPFSGMIFSGSVYFGARRGQQNYTWRHWHNLLVMLELLALVTFYASGNYWVIQQAGLEWFALEQVPIAWFFWAFTFGVPLLYIMAGLSIKDRLLLDIGLGCIGAAVFTFRYYFQVLPLAWAGTIAGAVLFILAYTAIRYLHRYDRVFTYAAETDKSLLQEVEEQLIEQTIANQPSATPPAQQDTFGGGQFGGGGAGDNF